MTYRRPDRTGRIPDTSVEKASELLFPGSFRRKEENKLFKVRTVRDFLCTFAKR